MIGRRLAVSIIAVLLPWTAASAQDTSKPLRVIVATGAGGTSDVFMRVIGEEYHRRFGRPVIVENRTGGSMNIGGRACADAAPDGNTICHLPSAALVYNQFLYKKLPFNPESLVPITNFFFNTQLLVVSTALGVSSLDELAALSRAKSGTLSYTAPSEPLVVFMEWWREKHGVDIVKVPFKGGGDSVNAMLSGSTPVAFFGMGNWLPHLAAGTVRPLAVDSETRSQLLPDVPTLRELGYTGDITHNYFGLMAPPGTPRVIVTRYYEQFAGIGREPDFLHKHVIDIGLEPVFDTPDDFTRFLKEDRERASRIVQAAGLSPL